MMESWPHPDDQPLSRGEKVFGAVIAVLTLIGAGMTIWGLVVTH